MGLLRITAFDRCLFKQTMWDVRHRPIFVALFGSQGAPRREVEKKLAKRNAKPPARWVMNSKDGARIKSNQVFQTLRLSQNSSPVLTKIMGALSLTC